ncbi:MAG: YfiR family protein [Pseudomonadota bacterium]
MIRTRNAAQRRFASGMAAVCLWVGWGVCCPAAEVHSEDSVKAAFIFRFAGYVEWPREADASQPFTIAVMGSGDIVMRLQTLALNRTLHNRPVKVRRVSGMRDVADAQVLYISPQHRADLKNLVSTAGRKAILVITDEEQGLDSGSSINLLMVDRRVRFEVSTEAAQRAGLAVSSELLSVATRVQGGRSPQPPPMSSR